MPRSQRLIATAVAALIGVAIWAPAKPANAYSAGPCHWSSHVRANGVGYLNTSASGYVSSTHNASLAWDAAQSHIDLYVVTSAPGFGVYTYSDPSSGVAAYTIHPCNSDNTFVYGSATIWINTAAEDPYGSTARKAFMVHEMGHLLGLNHTPASTTCPMPMMEGGAGAYSEFWTICNESTPQPDDVNGVLYLYP